MKNALRMGVVIETFHARYTFMQKRLKVMISRDEAMRKSQKYAKRSVRMSNRDIWDEETTNRLELIEHITSMPSGLLLVNNERS